VTKSKLTELRNPPTRCEHCPVRKKALFQVVADDYLSDAESRRAGQYVLAARSHLYQEGAPANMAYTLFDGWLLLYRTHSDGSRQGLRIALPGDFIGYAVLNSAYSHGAMAVTDAIACGFDQADLHLMINKNSDIARQVDNIQAQYLMTCESNVLGLGRKSAEQRIAHVVADLYHRLGRRSELDEQSRRMPFPLTQEMLGELAGLTPVHTNRVLRKLRGDGVMICDRQQIEILDLGRLTEIADYRPSDLL
jgi:CRP/FNR family transcriptional regulator